MPSTDQASISQTYTISDGGTIKLLYLEAEMSASGLRPSELARKIEAAYKTAEIFTKPNVTIRLVKRQEFSAMQVFSGRSSHRARWG